MSADNLQPIFPPTDLNYSAEAIQAAEAILDNTTREILASDKARMTQITALSAFTLGQALDLEPETLLIFQQAAVERINLLSPLHHEYVNRLLGSVAATLNGQIQHDSTARSKVAEAVIPKETDSLPAETPNICVEDVDRQDTIEIKELEPVIERETAKEVEVEKILEPDIEPIEWLPRNDIIEFTEHPQLYRHLNYPKYMKNFLKGAMPSREIEIEKLSNDATSLLTWEILEYYSTADIAKSTPQRKVKQRERIEAHIGLHTPPLSAHEVAQQMGLSDPSVYNSLQKVKETLERIISNMVASDMIRKSEATLGHTDLDQLFVFEKENSNNDILEVLDKKDNRNSQVETAQSNVIDKNITNNERFTSTDFYQHNRAPANMRNFLLRSFPLNFSERILDLDQYHLSLLTHVLIDEFASLEQTGLSEDQKDERCQQLQKWTGLYGIPVEYEEIAKASHISSNSVKSRIDNAIAALDRNITKDTFKELFNHVHASPEPRRKTAVR